MPVHHRHPLTTLALSGIALLAAVSSGACSKQETASPTPTTAAGGTPTIQGLHDSGPVTPATGPLEGCISKVPGEFLTEAEAVVRLSPSAVCPGFVTVKPGTTVTFTNTDATKPHTLVITRGTAAPTTTERDPSAPASAVPTTAAEAPVLSTTIPAGGTATQTFDTAGQFTFTTDAIPGYRGTVDVRS